MRRLLFILGPLFIGSVVWSIPLSIQFQGRLTDNQGNPISGSPQIRIEIYSQQNGGSSLWSQDKQVNSNDAGLFSTDLGPFNDPTLFTDNQNLFFQVSVRTTGRWQALDPRKPLLSVPFAVVSEQSISAQTASKVGKDAITGTEILDGSVLNADLSMNAVTSDKIQDGTIESTDFKDDSIDGDKIKDGSIQSVDLSTFAVRSINIEENTIMANDIGPDAILSTNVANGQLKAEDFALDSITTGIIKDGEVSSDDLADQAVQPKNVAAGYQLIPSGGIILWMGQQCPAGFTRFAGLDDRFPLGTATTPGTQGGDSQFQGVTVDNGGGHTHSIRDHGHHMPHRHTTPVIAFTPGPPFITVGFPSDINQWSEGRQTIVNQATFELTDTVHSTPHANEYLKTTNPDTTGTLDATQMATNPIADHSHTLSNDGTWKPPFLSVLFCQAN